MLFLCGIVCPCIASAEQLSKPNVLFIAMDDLNDWIGCLDGHPQTITPNLDRLAATGALFTNAHCPAPACNPCRSAIFTGRAPNRSGMYDNRQKMREVMPDEVLIPKHFSNHGYHSAGSGKLLHYFIDANSWNDFFPKASSENPLPRTFYPKNRPVNLPRGGPWQYMETDWAPLDVTDEEFGGDWLVSKWVGEQLSQQHEKPFFLACGIYRPHEPWFVPAKFFEPFPLDSIQLPVGYKEDDLDDVPAEGARAARNRYFAHIQAQGQWRQGIQGYLASIHFADAMLGRVLDALESSPNADNTIVVLWSDHGWQLGEKEHWQKYTPWRAVTRVPLMIRIPESSSETLRHGTTPGTVCDAPVNLLSLYPTLTELCGLPAKPNCDGPSLVPLLLDSTAEWPHRSVTFLSKPGAYAASGRRHRYIHYAEGGEEFYDIHADPYEWNNLAANESSAELMAEFRETSPTHFAKRVEPSVESLTKLSWNPAINDGVTPPSKPDGNPFPVHFENRRKRKVELFWMDREGNPRSYGTIAPGKRKTQSTRPGAVWMLQDAGTQQNLGHFTVGDRTAQAIIPRKRAKWVTLSTSTVPTARHEAALVGFDNKLYLLGGRRINPVDVFDPATNMWAAKSPTPMELHHFQGVVVEDRIYLMGAMTGRFPRETPLEKVVVYQPKSDTFDFVHSIPESRRRGGAGAVTRNGKIYLVGGITNGHIDGSQPWFDEYDPKTGEWKILPDAPHARDHFQAVVIGDRLYAAGGRQTSQATKQVFELTEEIVDVFDFASGGWLPPVQCPKLPTPRAGTSSVVVDGKLVVGGGESGWNKIAHDEVEVYDPVTNTWESWSSYQRGRHGSGLVRVGDSLYTASGSGNRGGSPELVSTERLRIVPMKPHAKAGEK